jgi:hypothetical protein
VKDISDMEIRLATEADLPTMMAIYAAARKFMADIKGGNE